MKALQECSYLILPSGNRQGLCMPKKLRNFIGRNRIPICNIRMLSSLAQLQDQISFIPSIKVKRHTI